MVSVIKSSLFSAWNVEEMQFMCGVKLLNRSSKARWYSGRCCGRSPTTVTRSWSSGLFVFTTKSIAAISGRGHVSHISHPKVDFSLKCFLLFISFKANRIASTVKIPRRFGETHASPLPFSCTATRPPMIASPLIFKDSPAEAIFTACKMKHTKRAKKTTLWK